MRAKETGLIAFDTETNSLDANQAELVGLSLALAPGEAAYVPLAHRGEDNLFGGGVTPGQLADDVLARLKPMLEDRSILKVGHNVKFDWLILKRHGIDVRPFDDTLLISYVLDAGRYGLRAMAWTSSPTATSATRPSTSRRLPALASRPSPSTASRSTRRPATPPRTLMRP